MGNVDWEDLKEKVGGFCSRFFSIVIAVLLCLFTFIFLVGAARLVGHLNSFKTTGFAHFLAILFAIASAVSYTVIHFLPKKAYRLMYLITFFLVISIFLTSHSMGLTAPTVDDCDELGFFNATALLNDTVYQVGQLGFTIVKGGNGTQAIGRLGQNVSDCTDSSLTFAAAILILIIELIALFDTQRMLLTRVRSKTYGERFVEMGIK